MLSGKIAEKITVLDGDINIAFIENKRPSCL
jgi:hypothetical protein